MYVADIRGLWQVTDCGKGSHFLGMYESLVGRFGRCFGYRKQCFWQMSEPDVAVHSEDGDTD